MKYMAEPTVWDSFAAQVVDAFSNPRLNGLPRVNSVDEVSARFPSPVNLNLWHKRGFIIAKERIAIVNALSAILHRFPSTTIYEASCSVINRHRDSDGGGNLDTQQQFFGVPAQAVI
jgi:hypothetical protein